MKLLIFAGSLRVDSCNKKFAREALRLVQEAGIDAELVDLKDYHMPVYDGDLETASGIPEFTVKLGKKIASADALIISTPEYNGGIPGILKNVVDWLSREKPVLLLINICCYWPRRPARWVVSAVCGIRASRLKRSACMCFLE